MNQPSHPYRERVAAAAHGEEVFGNLGCTACHKPYLPLDSLTPSPTPTITPIPAEVLGLVVQVIDGDTLHIIDLKWGRGVQVDAENNEQLILYALGALDSLDPLGEIEPGLQDTDEGRDWLGLDDFGES